MSSKFMERFLKRKPLDDAINVGSSRQRLEHNHTNAANAQNIALEDINWEQEIQFDPGKRKEIYTYHPNQREAVIRKYLVNGPCQPRTLDFLITEIGSKSRKFNPDWFDEFGSWIEYSESKDRVYCFPCFLMRDRLNKSAGYKAFVVEGWNSWQKKDGLRDHVGGVGSPHNKALKDCEALLKRKQHIDVVCCVQSEVAKNAYFVRLNSSIDVARVLLKQGLAFHGHDESKMSLNKGNFREIYDFLAEHDPTLAKAVGHNGAANSLMLSHDVQKDIVNYFANEILHSILGEIGHDVFCLLIDESRDVSCKEQMAVVLRYVGSSGSVKESFVGLVHVKDTTSSNLKSCIDSLFAKYKLSLKQVRGQGYDGASNMRGEFNGLQSLIMRENSTSYYVHCFAHQLQLVIVAVVRKHKGISDFFSKIATLLNVVGGSSKRRDMIRDINLKEVRKALACGKIRTGTGLNQEKCLQRPGDTRWSSHYKSLKSLVELFPTIVKVLRFVEKEDKDGSNRVQAWGILAYFQSFSFVFYLQHEISRLDMEDRYIDPTRPRSSSGITNKHHYEVDCFNEILDWLVQELDNRFNKTSSQLLVCSAAFSPKGSFHDFSVERLMSLAKLYPRDFDTGQLGDLEQQLHLYIVDVRDDDRFSDIETVGELSQKLVETKKHNYYPLVYRLLKLVLVLPIATATVERCFSAMKVVKNKLRNRIGDDYMSDCLIYYVEKEQMRKVKNDDVVQRFLDMADRKYE